MCCCRNRFTSFISKFWSFIKMLSKKHFRIVWKQTIPNNLEVLSWRSVNSTPIFGCCWGTGTQAVPNQAGGKRLYGTAAGPGQVAWIMKVLFNIMQHHTESHKVTGVSRWDFVLLMGVLVVVFAHQLMASDYIVNIYIYYFNYIYFLFNYIFVFILFFVIVNSIYLNLWVLCCFQFYSTSNCRWKQENVCAILSCLQGLTITGQYLNYNSNNYYVIYENLIWPYFKSSYKSKVENTISESYSSSKEKEKKILVSILLHV